MIFKKKKKKNMFFKYAFTIKFTEKKPRRASSTNNHLSQKIKPVLESGGKFMLNAMASIFPTLFFGTP